MSRLAGFRGPLCTTIAVVWALSGGAPAAEPLRLVSNFLFRASEDWGRPQGFEVEVLRQVFAAMGQDVSFEAFPANRVWRMILDGERDGMINARRTSEHEGICSFPDEPLSRDRWVFFVRKVDVGKLRFSSFDDLLGHDVAVREQVSGFFEEPTVSPELWEFLHEHHNMVGTISAGESLRMLAAGRVDYAVVSLRFGMGAIASMGLSGKIEPLLSRSAVEDDFYVCFTKTRVEPAFVQAFSRALKQFKETEAFQTISRRYLP